MGTTAKLAEFISGARTLALSDELIEMTQHVILDTIGCAIGGYAVEAGRKAVAFSERQPGNASIIGSSTRVSPEAAIFANGQLMNVLDLDECMMNWGHQAPFVLPVALTVGEQLGASGAEVVRAFLVGYEVAVRISAALAGPVYATGDATSRRMESLPVFGYGANIFGGVAAAAVLMGLSKEQVEDALGIASYLAPVPNAGAFLVHDTIPMSKYGLMGSVAQSAYTAASLAQTGFTSDRTALDGNRFAKLVGSPRFDSEGVTTGLGENWWIPKVSFKLYPSCRMMHVAVDLLTDIAKQHNIAPDEVEQIDVQMWPRVAGNALFNNAAPVDPLTAQFSVPYTMATTLYGLNAFPEFVRDETMADPKVQALAGKVRLWPEARLTEARYERYGAEPIGPIDAAPCEVRVFTPRGKYVGYGETATGDSFDPAARIGADALRQKFRSCARQRLTVSDAATAENLLADLQNQPDIRDVFAALAGDSSSQNGRELARAAG